MSRMRPWLAPAAAAAAVVFFVAGVVVWRMYGSPAGHCNGGGPVLYLCGRGFGSHRLHPLRAELLWAASVVLALVAVGGSLRQRRGSVSAQAVRG